MSDLNNTPENDDIMGEAPTAADKAAMQAAVDAEAFNALMGAEFSADAFTVPVAPAVNTRKDGLHYLATNDGVASYELVVEGRVALHVLVNEAASVEVPAFLQGKIHPQATVHAIMVAKPDRSVILPTNGLAVMGKHYLNTDTIRSYIYPRAVHFLLLVWGIGA